MLEREKVEKVIGKTFADNLDEEIFKVNINWFYTKREMVEELGCANFIAAVKLAKVLKRLNVANPQELKKIDPISLARAKGVGPASLFVAMCILEKHNYDAVKWWGYNGNLNKFNTAARKARKRKQEV